MAQPAQKIHYKILRLVLVKARQFLGKARKSGALAVIRQSSKQKTIGLEVVVVFGGRKLPDINASFRGSGLH